MNISQSPNLNYAWGSLLMEELIRNGVDYFCISPGSRSAPLTASVASNPKAISFIHYDERGAAFHALGYVSATKRPCVLISTSGTAAANYFPAIIEASKKKLPLIVLTADRPPELRQTGADQTIDQVKIFGDYVRWQFDLPCPTKEIKPQVVLTTIDQAVYRTKGVPAGPVHINCMFREPLAPVKAQENYSQYLNDLRAWQESGQPYTIYSSPKQSISTSQKQQINQAIRQIRNGVIVVGKLSNSLEQKAVLKLAEYLQWPIFPDITSGLRIGCDHQNVVSYFDQLLISEKFCMSLKIDGVLHLGGRISSKRWYQFIEQVTPAQYIMVNNHPLRNDPLHCVSLRIESDVVSFCDAMMGEKEVIQNLKHVQKLKSASDKIHALFDRLISQSKNLSEPSVTRLVTEHIPKDHGLFLANSMPIRDVDMYGHPLNAPVMIGANRGASGIDGTIATAAGFAVGLNKPVTLLIGDLAFLHDLNSLIMARALATPFVMIVLNNNGGGIFSFLPIAKATDVFEQYFGTPHNLTFESAAQLFKLNYAAPRTNADFIQEYERALKSKTATVIEIMSDRQQNSKIHQDIEKEVSTVITKFLA